MVQLPFADRLEAGRQLGAELSRHKFLGNATVVALARGGVPVGFAIADQLGCALDVIVARKIGVPWQKELAMGAIAGSAEVLDERMIRDIRVSREEVEEIVAQERLEMKRREDLYRGDRPALDVSGQTAILVDDGLATGSTMTAAVRHVRSLKPAKVMIAIPVGSAQACERLRREADELVCLAVPPMFRAVGEWYRDFKQVSDNEVQNMLAESRHRLRRQLELAAKG